MLAPPHWTQEIAREKAGIFKQGVPAFTVPQPAEAMEQLERTAAEVGASLALTPPLDAYAAGSAPTLGLPGAHQRVNAALAVALTRAFEERESEQGDGSDAEQAAARVKELAQGRLPSSYLAGLEAARWPGRAQVRRAGLNWTQRGWKLTLYTPLCLNLIQLCAPHIVQILT